MPDKEWSEDKDAAQPEVSLFHKGISTAYSEYKRKDKDNPEYIMDYSWQDFLHFLTEITL